MARAYHPKRPTADAVADRVVARAGSLYSLPPSADAAVRELVRQELAGSSAGGDAEDAELDARVAKMRRPAASLSVTQPRTYARWKDTTPGSMFLLDLMRAQLFRDGDARRRLDQHMAEEADGPRGRYIERANAGTGNLAGLLVPAYLLDLYAPAVAALRPFADICNPRPLPPDGMTVNLGQVATGSSAAVQSPENSALSSTAPVLALLTEQVQTIGATVQASRQLLERGQVDAMLAEDMLRAYNTALDSTLISQAVTGLNALSTIITYTSATPTAAGAHSKILAAAASVSTHLLGQASPDYAIMTEQRWWWMSEPGTSWPVVSSPSPAPALSGGVMHPEEDYRKGIRGVLPSGLQIVADNNVGQTFGAGTQDRIYLVASRECILWELPGDGNPAQVGSALGQVQGTPMLFVKAGQQPAAQLGVTLSLWSYMAFCFRRFSGAVAAVDGTGLIAPVFA